MTVSFKILAKEDIVYFRYSGHIRAGETKALLAKLTVDPDYHPKLQQLADFTEVVSVELDYAKAMQAMRTTLAELKQVDYPPTPIYLAPTDVAMSFAKMICHLWDGLPMPQPIICETTDEALRYLDDPDDRLRQVISAPLLP
ncbi:MAG: hypothetical protein VX181_13165 [Pseudomonadota bacterium]|nr:hypothetical protein [Pseudomonadota bacterium]